MEFDELVRKIADWETSPETEPTDEHLEEIEIALHHNHLPKIEDHGIIDYDSRSKTIRYWDDITKQTWIEQAKIKEIGTKTQTGSRIDKETVINALKPTLKAAYNTDVELERSSSCYTDPEYPDWDVTIVEVNKPPG